MPDSFSFMQGSSVFSSGRLSFTRPVPTADPLGARIAENIPRFGRPTTFTGVLTTPETIDSSLAAGSTLLHVGLDRDGLTPVAVVTEPSTRSIKIYRESFSGNVPRLKLVRHTVLPTDTGIGSGDLLGTLTPNSPIGSLCFDPTTMLVVHGTLVALCRVSRKIATGQWQIQGIGLCYSTNLGKSWVKYWTDLDSPRDLGRLRLAGWEMTNYYTPYVADGKSPLEVFIPFSDYRTAGLPNPSTGGRIAWFKMSRTSRTDSLVPLWGPGGPGTNDHRMACFTLDSNPADLRYCHVHAVGVCEYTPPGKKPGLQILAGVGDGAVSSILRILVKDPAQYWLSTLPGGTPNWSIQPNFHGRADTAVIDPVTAGPGVGEHQNLDQVTGLQFVGCGPGYDPGTLILGSDAVGEGVVLLQPGNAPDSKPQIQSLATDFGSITKSNCFYVRVDRPERPTRTVACGMKITPYANGRPIRGPVDLIWFSRESGRPGTWGCISYENIEERYSLLNDSIYALSNGGTKFVKISLPPTRAGRPLLIGPGGSQWLRDDPTRLNVSGLQVQRCPRDTQGRWLYPSADGSTTLGVIDPQPPVMVDAVFRVRKKLEDANGGMMLTVSGSQTHPRTGSQLLESARLDPLPGDPPSDPPRPMWLRAFFRNTPVDLDLASYDANRNPTSFDVTTSFDGVPRGIADMYLVAQDRWQAVNCAVHSSVGTGEWFSFICRSRTASSDSDGIIAFSEFLSDTYRGPGYPLPPDQPECWPEPPPDFPGWGCFPRATDFPDELAQINALGLNGNWTLLLAGMCADDSWDQFTLTDPTDNAHVLFSLLTAQSEGARITLRATTRVDASANVGLTLCYQAAAKATELRRILSPVSFHRNRPVLLALTCNSSLRRLTLTAAASGNILPPLVVSTPIATEAFAKLSFSGPDGQGTVSAFQWLAMKTESRVLSDAEILSQFQTLGFFPG